jgi:hypothetical protein
VSSATGVSATVPEAAPITTNNASFATDTLAALPTEELAIAAALFPATAVAEAVLASDIAS